MCGYWRERMVQADGRLDGERQPAMVLTTPPLTPQERITLKLTPLRVRP